MSSVAPTSAPSTDGIASRTSRRLPPRSSRRKPTALASDPGQSATVFVMLATIGSRPSHTKTGNDSRVPPPATELMRPATRPAPNTTSVLATLTLLRAPAVGGPSSEPMIAWGDERRRMAHDLFERRVLFVVGKGGVGKSTVAALLAVALAERGKRVLLAQMGPGRRLGEVLGVDGGTEAPAEVCPGLLRREARKVLDLLEDPIRTAVCPVTTAEEMPVNETREMYAQLCDHLKMPLGVLFVNRMHTAPLAPDDVPTAPAGASSLLVDVLRCGREEAGWAAINAHYLARLRAAVPMPTVELPFLF